MSESHQEKPLIDQMLKEIIRHAGIENWPATFFVSSKFRALTVSVVNESCNQLKLPQEIHDSVANIQLVKMRFLRFLKRQVAHDRQRAEKVIKEISAAATNTSSKTSIADLLFSKAYFFFPFTPQVEEKFLEHFNYGKSNFPLRNNLLLNQAAYTGNIRLVRWLLDRGMLIGKDFMWHLCQSCSVTAMQQLYPLVLEKFPRFKFDHTMLELASAQGNPEVVAFILEKTPELNQNSIVMTDKQQSDLPAAQSQMRPVLMLGQFNHRSVKRTAIIPAESFTPVATSTMITLAGSK